MSTLNGEDSARIFFTMYHTVPDLAGQSLNVSKVPRYGAGLGLSQAAQLAYLFVM